MCTNTKVVVESILNGTRVLHRWREVTRKANSNASNIIIQASLSCGFLAVSLLGHTWRCRSLLPTDIWHLFVQQQHLLLENLYQPCTVPVLLLQCTCSSDAWYDTAYLVVKWIMITTNTIDAVRSNKERHSKQSASMHSSTHSIYMHSPHHATSCWVVQLLVAVVQQNIHAADKN